MKIAPYSSVMLNKLLPILKKDRTVTVNQLTPLFITCIATRSEKETKQLFDEIILPLANNNQSDKNNLRNAIKNNIFLSEKQCHPYIQILQNKQEVLPSKKTNITSTYITDSKSIVIKRPSAQIIPSSNEKNPSNYQIAMNNVVKELALIKEHLALRRDENLSSLKSHIERKILETKEYLKQEGNYSPKIQKMYANLAEKSVEDIKKSIPSYTPPKEMENKNTFFNQKNQQEIDPSIALMSNIHLFVTDKIDGFSKLFPDDQKNIKTILDDPMPDKKEIEKLKPLLEVIAQGHAILSGQQRKNFYGRKTTDIINKLLHPDANNMKDINFIQRQNKIK
jgi:hypothetical protein